jgi:hypothetical protein
MALARMAAQEEKFVVPFVAGSPRHIPGGSMYGPSVPTSVDAPAAAYDYNKETSWRSYVNADGSIRSTPRSRFGF